MSGGLNPVADMLEMADAGSYGHIHQIAANVSPDRFLSLPRDNWRLKTDQAPAGGIHLLSCRCSFWGRQYPYWHSRRVIGALNMSVALRRPPWGCIHHKDSSRQNCSHDDQKILRKHGLTAFLLAKRGKGNCCDNSDHSRQIFLENHLPGNGRKRLSIPQGRAGSARERADPPRRRNSPL